MTGYEAPKDRAGEPELDINQEPDNHDYETIPDNLT